MKKVIVLCALLIVPMNAFAYLINTGVVHESQYPLGYNPVDLYERHFYGKVQLNEGANINSIESYFKRGGNDFHGHLDQSIQIALYQGSAFNAPDHPSPGIEHPDFNQLIYKDAFVLPGGQSHDDWRGFSGLDFHVDPGVYWFSVGGQDDALLRDTGVGRAQSPLNQYASKYDFSYFGPEQNPPQFSLRVNGVATPEPASLLLFGMAGAGLLLFRRKA